MRYLRIILPASIIPALLGYQTGHYPFTLPPLPYDYTSLEPHIDEATMRVHHQGHHLNYVNKLNDALKEHPELQQYSGEELLKNLPKMPKDIRQAIQNNAGGHVNHSFFWQCLAPNTTQMPSKQLLKAITKTFGTFLDFKSKFNEAAKKAFGSGWVWLCYNPSLFSIFSKNRLVIVTTVNQDSPIPQGLIPLLGLDLWEHAYYLKHQNKRDAYIDSWWNVVNWAFVDRSYDLDTRG